jgi:hypothetical protein
MDQKYWLPEINAFENLEGSGFFEVVYQPGSIR